MYICSNTYIAALWNEGSSGAPPAAAPSVPSTTTQPPGIGGTTTSGGFGDQDWMGTTTTTQDWGADEGGEWNGTTDTNVCTYILISVLYISLLFRSIGNCQPVKRTFYNRRKCCFDYYQFYI